MKTSRPRPLRATGLALLAGLLAAACAAPFSGQLTQVSGRAAVYYLPPEVGIEACRSALRDPPAAGAELDARQIRLVNWNVRKQSASGWQRDYDRLADDRDLVLIQEVSLRPDTVNGIPAAPHWSFAPGYRDASQVTGVLTLSSVKPLTRCSFVSVEPLLRTPKSTGITQYGLTASDETLVVVNLHAINFSLGLSAFERQFARIGILLDGHDGPVILSGDFNTWRAGRQCIVNALAERLRLAPLQFAEDHRIRVLGQPLDHIYVRGLSALDTATQEVDTSDHNPMIVTLSTQPRTPEESG